jgi:hypothetical protein
MNKLRAILEIIFSRHWIVFTSEDNYAVHRGHYTRAMAMTAADDLVERVGEEVQADQALEEAKNILTGTQ